jgi:hypothetical protein
LSKPLPHGKKPAKADPAHHPSHWFDLLIFRSGARRIRQNSAAFQISAQDHEKAEGWSE